MTETCSQETILITGRQYNFSLQTTNSSFFEKKQTQNQLDVYYIHSTKFLLGIITLKKTKKLTQT